MKRFPPLLLMIFLFNSCVTMATLDVAKGVDHKRENRENTEKVVEKEAKPAAYGLLPLMIPVDAVRLRLCAVATFGMP